MELNDILKEYKNTIISSINNLKFISNNIKLNENENKIFKEINQSVIYRLDSLIYHFILVIDNYKRNSYNIAANDPLIARWDYSFLRLIENSMLFLFDDISFSICSLLDYIGNLIGLIYCGSNKSSIKWNGLLKLINKKESKISNQNLIKTIIQHHKIWIDDFYNYRSKIIHYKKDKTQASEVYEVTIERFSVKLKVNAPEQFIKHMKAFKDLNPNIKHENIQLIDATIWIIDSFYSVFNNILLDLKNINNIEPPQRTTIF